MTLITGIRNLIHRRKTPLAIDLAGTQADRLTEDVRAAATASSDAIATTAAERPPVPGLTPARRSDDDLAKLLGEFSDRLGDQTAQVQGLMQLSEKLPQALEAMTEVKRQCTHILELLGDQFDQVRNRNETLETTVGRISEVSAHHTEVVGLLQRQVESHTQAIRQATANLEAITQSLGDVAESCNASLQVLSDLDRTSEGRESRISEGLSGLQRWMILLTIGCGTASLIAIILAVSALLN